MPQAVILAAATTIFVLIVISSNFWVSLVAFFPIAIVAFVLMYYRVNKIPVYEFILIYLVYIGTPKLLIYRSDNLKSDDEKEEGIGFIDIEPPSKKAVENPKQIKRDNSKTPKKKAVSQKKNVAKKKTAPSKQTQKKSGSKNVKPKKGVR